MSAVVPALDEAAAIGALVRRLLALGCAEVVVADGGSRDGTPARAAEAGARVIAAPRGRSVQLNAGARAARGAVFWFVHADAGPPDGAVDAIRAALRDPMVVAGAFRTRTVDERATAPPPRWYRLADLRQSYTRHPYGDQGLFARAGVFHALGGYREDLRLMEDVDLSRRLARAGRLVILPPEIRVSARRYQASPLRAVLAVNLFPIAWRLGVPTRWLERAYGRGRRPA